MRVFAILPLLSLLLALPALAIDPPTGIKGRDDRTEVDARAYPWSAIGRLHGAGGRRCTGTLIGPRTVLTAAHCLWDAPAGDWAKTADLSFSSGYRAGWRLGTAPVSGYDIASGYEGSLRDNLSRGANDWAVVHLRAPLGERSGWLGLLPLSPDTWQALAARQPVIILAGYAADRPLTLFAHLGCHLLGWAEPGLVAHDCDATEGESGAPLFSWMDGAFRVVGLHVATARRPAGQPFGGPEHRDGFGAAIPAGSFADAVAGLGASARGSVAGATPPIREVETALALLGYAPEINGRETAIRAFQRDHHLLETGTPSAALLGHLLDALR